jgi:hypothetical protein
MNRNPYTEVIAWYKAGMNPSARIQFSYILSSTWRDKPIFGWVRRSASYRVLQSNQLTDQFLYEFLFASPVGTVLISKVGPTE